MWVKEKNSSVIINGRWVFFLNYAKSLNLTKQNNIINTRVDYKVNGGVWKMEASMPDRREEFVSNLGNPYVNPKSKELELLFTYIQTENEMLRKFDEEDGIDVEAKDYVPNSIMMKRLEDMENYRIAKTLLASVQRMIKLGICNNNQEYIIYLDTEQRRKHNKALTSLMGMNEFAQKQGLDLIYTGKLVKKEDIRDLGTGDTEARKEMTNFFLGLLTELSKYNIRGLKNENMKKEIHDIQKKIETTSKDYNVKKGLASYEDEIEFYDWI